MQLDVQHGSPIVTNCTYVNNWTLSMNNSCKYFEFEGTKIPTLVGGSLTPIITHIIAVGKGQKNGIRGNYETNKLHQAF